MRNFFNAENWLWKPLGVLGDLVMLSLLWTVFSIPVVTLGPASAALYDAAANGLRRHEDTVVARFFSTFRRELKEGALSTVLALCAALTLSAPLLWLMRRGRGGAVLPAAWILLLFFLLCVLCWLWPTLSRFTMDLRPLLSASVKLAFGHILRSAAMAILWAGTLYAGVRFVAPLFLCPAVAALLSTFLIEPVFRRYE